MDWIERFKKLNNLEKFAIFCVIAIFIFVFLAVWKQSAFFLGATGESGIFMPFLHHSRWGAIMVIIGAYLMLTKKDKTLREIALILIIVGLILVIQHLATEQCFALFTKQGLPAGGIC